MKKENKKEVYSNFLIIKKPTHNSVQKRQQGSRKITGGVKTDRWQLLTSDRSQSSR